MNTFILTSLLSFSLATDHFSLGFRWDDDPSYEFELGFYHSQGGGILATGPINLEYQQHFTCSTCEHGKAEVQTTVETTDGSNTILKASTVSAFVDGNFLTPYWGSGKSFTMSWNSDGSNVTFYVSGTPSYPYCYEDFPGYNYLLITDDIGNGQPGYVSCSSIGSFRIEWE